MVVPKDKLIGPNIKGPIGMFLFFNFLPKMFLLLNLSNLAVLSLCQPYSFAVALKNSYTFGTTTSSTRWETWVLHSSFVSSDWCKMNKRYLVLV